MNALIEKFKQTQAYINYSRMWPYVKPYWFRALMAVLICIPIGSLDAVIALALKPYMDLVMVEKTVESPWYIPFGIVAFTCIQGMLNYLASYLNTWVGGKITNDLKAFIKNAPIVILDEATSALDNKSEAIVQKAIDNLMKDKTVFVIAHRLSTVQNAHRIAVINEGKLTELGTHDELMQIENGLYKNLYNMQFKKQEAVAV